MLNKISLLSLTSFLCMICMCALCLNLMKNNIDCIEQNIKDYNKKNSVMLYGR